MSILLSSLPFSCSVVSNSATPWAAAQQASLSITKSQSLLKPKFIELVMPSNHLILSFPSPPAFNLSGKLFFNIIYMFYNYEKDLYQLLSKHMTNVEFISIIFPLNKKYTCYAFYIIIYWSTVFFLKLHR